MSYFGDYLREARGSRSLSRAAAVIGCTKAHLWELEAGRADNPGIKLLAGMARAYAIPLTALAEAWEQTPTASQSGEASQLGASEAKHRDALKPPSQKPEGGK